jgi:hypothetical protein
MRRKTAPRAAGPKMQTQAWWAKGSASMGPWVISLVVCLVAAVMVVAAGRPSSTAANEQSVAQLAQSSAPRTATPAQTKSPAKSQAPGAPKRDVQDLFATTVEGCLQAGNETFRLVDTAGEGAPKSRSWKSGFLKKETRSIEIVDATKRLNLASHADRRVAVTGVLDGGEMHARSIRRVPGECE